MLLHAHTTIEHSVASSDIDCELCNASPELVADWLHATGGGHGRYPTDPWSAVRAVVCMSYTCSVSTDDRRSVHMQPQRARWQSLLLQPDELDCQQAD